MNIISEISPAAEGLELCVVIPALGEPSIGSALRSVHESMLQSGIQAELLLVLNQGEEADQSLQQLHRDSFEELREMKNEMPHLQIMWVRDIPSRRAGVGMARKLGMDLAAERLTGLGNQRAVIACLDADCTVRPDYIRALRDGFAEHTAQSATSIYFEHPYEKLEDPLRAAIVLYETHLRLFKSGQQWAGHPHAFHTVGSAMAVRADAYERQGGMNKRKAGEDFYFLHKFIEIGRCFELGTTTVYPSARVSGRVPFGTGKAVGDYISCGRQLSYHPQSYCLLKSVVNGVEGFYRGSRKLEPKPGLGEWAAQVRLAEQIAGIRQHSADYRAFRKRFFRWFNAFRVMKMFHFLREWYPDLPVEQASESMMDRFGLAPTMNPETDLELLRSYEMRQMSHALSS